MSKDDKHSIRNNTNKNQDYLNVSETMETGYKKQIDTIGGLKDDILYILDIMCDNFQEKLLGTFWVTKKEWRTYCKGFVRWKTK